MTHPMTPEQEEQVRRALAATARAEDEATPPTMPAAVAARLDGVLAELAQGRSDVRAGADPDQPGRDRDELARHRARRRRDLLVAAAAVVVIAAAGGTVVTRGFGGTTGSSDSSASSDAGGSAYDEVGPEKAAAPSAGDSGNGSARSVAGLPALRSSSLATDVRRVASTTRAARPDALAGGKRADGAACARPDAPRGADVVDVRLDGDPATLVVDRAAGGAREARVYSCSDGSTPVVTTTLPAR